MNPAAGPFALDDVSASEWQQLATRRIFFGHQSVGRDLMDGVRRVLVRRPEIRLNLVTDEDPAKVSGPALIDARIGRNREPATKADAFERALAGGFGSEDGAVAMFKYCYVDLLRGTDPDALFADYAARVETLGRRYPGLVIAHVTMPLHRAPTGWVERLRTRLGADTETARNVARNRFNDLLRQRLGEEPIFDLALLQSVRADGSRAFSRTRGRKVYMLAPEWTGDGGHLLPEAQDRIAEQFLAFLAHLPARSRAALGVAAHAAT